MGVTETFTAREAAQLSGLTLSMVNYLCRANVLEPSGRSQRGRGKWRAYTFADIVVLRALKRFLQSGISVAHLKEGLRDLRKHHPEIAGTRMSSRFLVTDGRRVYLRKKRHALEALDGTGQFVFGFVVELTQVRNEVYQALKRGGMQ